MFRANLPSVLECWRRLELLDDQMAAAQDRRTWRRLEENRKWWADQLLESQSIEGYPKEAHDTNNGATTTTQSG